MSRNRGNHQDAAEVWMARNSPGWCGSTGDSLPTVVERTATTMGERHHAIDILETFQPAHTVEVIGDVARDVAEQFTDEIMPM